MAANTIQQSKACTKCGKVKPLSDYHKAKDCKFGVKAHCKDCACAYAARRHHENKDELTAKMRERRKSDPDAARQYHRAWYAKNTKTRKRYKQEWIDKYPDRYRKSVAATHQKRSQNARNRIEATIRTAINRSIKSGCKTGRTFDALGFSFDDLKRHLERQFLSEMSWENYGEWHIDHVLPLSSFNYAKPDDDEFKAAWSLTNLRPLWKSENLKKGAKRLTLL